MIVEPLKAEELPEPDPGRAPLIVLTLRLMVDRDAAITSPMTVKPAVVPMVRALTVREEMKPWAELRKIVEPTKVVPPEPEPGAAPLMVHTTSGSVSDLLRNFVHKAWKNFKGFWA